MAKLGHHQPRQPGSPHQALPHSGRHRARRRTARRRQGHHRTRRRRAGFRHTRTYPRRRHPGHQRRLHHATRPSTAHPASKQAIIAKFHRDNGLDYRPEQILVSCGGKQSFYNLCQALLNRGDEVIIPAPYWVSYPDMVLLADGKPVIIPTGVDTRFKITPAQLEAAITPGTRVCGHQQPVEPDRRRLQPGRAGRARRGAAPAPAGADRHRRHVRTHPLDGRSRSATSSTPARTSTSAPSC